MTKANVMTDEKLEKAQAAQEQADEQARANEAQPVQGSADPTKSLVSEGVSLARVAGEGLRTLKPGHTERDRIEAQAEKLGIPTDDSMSTEWIRHLILMKASA